MWHRQFDPRLSLVAVAVANLIPLIGVLVFDWSVLMVVLIYWIETGLYGGALMLKMLTAQGPDDPEDYPETDDDVFEWPNWKHVLFQGSFFVLFWLVGGGFAVGLIAQAVSVAGFSASSLLLATVAFGLSHALLYWSEHVLTGQYKRHGPLAFVPDLFDRILMLQAILLGGLFVAAALGSPLGLVATLVLIKGGVDVHEHWRRME